MPFLAFIKPLLWLMMLTPLAMWGQILPGQWAIGATGNLAVERAGDRLALGGRIELETWRLLSPRWAVGGQISITGNTLDQHLRLTIGPMGRFYLRNAPEGWLPYLHGSLAYGYRTFEFLNLNVSPVRMETVTQTEGLVQGGLGLSRFLNPSVLVEIEAGAFHPFPLSSGTSQAPGNAFLQAGFLFLLSPLR